MVEDTMVIEPDAEDVNVKPTAKELKAQRDARYREKKKAEAASAAKVKADKRRVAALKVHGASDKEIAKATTVRKTKRMTPAEERAAARAPVKGKLTMARTYQRDGAVAKGTVIAGGARQTVVTFPAEMFKKVAIMARDNGVSFSEQIRRFCAKAGASVT